MTFRNRFRISSSLETLDFIGYLYSALQPVNAQYTALLTLAIAVRRLMCRPVYRVVQKVTKLPPPPSELYQKIVLKPTNKGIESNLNV